MKLKITQEVEFTPVRLAVSACVRYWEDATVNGVEDTDGTLIPLRKGDAWEPVIDLETGRIISWPAGTTADIHYKVCDAGKYWLEDAAGEQIQFKGYYVPQVLGDTGGGDYIILKVSDDGLIEGWKQPEIDDEQWNQPLAPARSLL